MKNAVKEIITSVHKGLIIDTHTVIEIMLQNYTDIYLTSFSGGSVESYHGLIGKAIEKLEGTLLIRKGDSYSKNIRDSFSKVACWERL